jgi:hypothetical protein
MNKKYFAVSEDSAMCMDECKYISGPCIGSIACQNCDHNKEFNFDEKWIICERYNNDEIK